MREGSEKGSFYTTVPGVVRFDESISARCAFLYGDIAALCNQTGECFATNAYLAKINGVDRKTASKWISELEKAGHIKCRVVMGESGEITARFIKLGTPVRFPVDTPVHEKVEDNSTSQNSTEYTTIVPVEPSRKPVVETVVSKEPKPVKVGCELWDDAHTNLQKFMAYYVGHNMNDLYHNGTKERVNGFFKQYGGMFSKMLATAGNLETAQMAVDEAEKYFKRLGFPWGLKALNTSWAMFVNSVMERRRKNA